MDYAKKRNEDESVITVKFPFEICTILMILENVQNAWLRSGKFGVCEF